MSRSLILSSLSRTGKAILRVYDGSAIEKAYASFCAYFAKKAEESVLLDFLRNRFMQGEAVKNCATAKVLRSPVTLARKIYGQNEDGISQIKENSTLFDLFAEPLRMPLSGAGHLLFAFSLGLLPNLFLHRGKLNLLLTALLFVFSLLLFLFPVPIGTALSESRLCAFFKRVVLLDEKKTTYTPLGGFEKTLCPLCFLFGLSALFCKSFGALLLLCGAAALLLIAAKPYRGVCLLIPLAAILPTMALAGLTLFCAFAAALHLLFGKTAPRGESPFLLWIATFLALSFFAVLGGAAPVSGMKIYLIYLAFALSFPLILYTVRTRRDFTRILTLLCGASFLVALYGVFQNFFLKDTTQSWVDSSMFTEIERRVYSTLDNPNVLGEYLILTIPLAACLLLYTKRPLSKFVYLGVNGVMLLCLMYTWSRGAWVGVVLALGFFLLQKDRRFLIPCLAILLLMPSVMPASILHRLTSIGNMKDTSTAYRVSVWQGSIRIIRDYGFFGGIGLGSDAFLKVYPRYALNGAEYALHSHNFYLQWIVDMGWGGILVYFGFILTAFSCILRAKKNRDPKKIAALAMSGGLCGYLFHGMAENLWYNYRMVLVFFIYLALICLAAGGDKNEENMLSEETT